jgi:hypothetical protein
MRGDYDRRVDLDGRKRHRHRLNERDPVHVRTVVVSGRMVVVRLRPLGHRRLRRLDMVKRHHRSERVPVMMMADAERSTVRLGLHVAFVVHRPVARRSSHGIHRGHTKRHGQTEGNEPPSASAGDGV